MSINLLFLTAVIIETSNAWQECSVSCGIGHRRRTVQSDAAITTCPVEEVRSCEEQPCPSDCLTSDWFPWQPCNCTVLVKHRHRVVLLADLNGGVPCPTEIESKYCDGTECSTNFCTERPDGLQPLPGLDCSRDFVMCSGGVLSVQNCSDGLVFSNTSSRCEYPEDVPDCFGKLASNTSEELIVERSTNPFLDTDPLSLPTILDIAPENDSAGHRIEVGISYLVVLFVLAASYLMLFNF